MKRVLMCCALVVAGLSAGAAQAFEADIIPTSAGNLEITFIGHGTLMFRHGGKVIHVDPWASLPTTAKLPKADLVLDHPRTPGPPRPARPSTRCGKTETVIVVPRKRRRNRSKGAVVMNNGDAKTVLGFTVEAVPAYNLVHMRSPGTPYHPKGDGNGYVVTFADKRVYIAGDTENTPEMKALRNIDVAFLPMNLPYTMTPEMVADAAKAFRPEDPLPVPLRGDGRAEARRAAEGRQGNRGENP